MNPDIVKIILRCREYGIDRVRFADHHGMRFLLSDDNGIVFRDDTVSYEDFRKLEIEINNLLV